MKWGGFAQELTTAMHEVIGHGSGRMAPGVTEPPHKLLGEQYSAIEEARADLVALYFLPDPKLVGTGHRPGRTPRCTSSPPSTSTTFATRWFS